MEASIKADIEGKFALKNEYLKDLLALLRAEFPEASKDEAELARMANSFYAPHI